MSTPSFQVRPFLVDIPITEVDRLKRKLQDTRVPTEPIVPDAGDTYGPSMSWIHRLYNKWLSLDWSRIQKHLNRLEHGIASIEDEGKILDIHFSHRKSSHTDAIPMIMIHGWPGSFYEFDKVADELAEPADPKMPAFHVVAPSLPGFCWSSGPPRGKWTMQDSARVLHKLMLGLDYTSYVAQAGDWGSFVARELGARFDECKAVHLNFCPTPLPKDTDMTRLTPREQRVEERCQAWLDDHLGYAVCMRTRPQTIGVALSDNPVGILMWVGEKYLELADPGYQQTKEDEWDEAILVQASLYYFSNCIMTSTLPYFENVKHAQFGTFFLKPENRINKPFGYTSFMYDSRPSTKRAVEQTGNLVYYNECDDGGHFAALERPDVLVDDCRKLFGQHFRC